jgi:hypothetical protein
MKQKNLAKAIPKSVALANGKGRKNLLVQEVMEAMVLAIAVAESTQKANPKVSYLP